MPSKSGTYLPDASADTSCVHLRACVTARHCMCEIRSCDRRTTRFAPFVLVVEGQRWHLAIRLGPENCQPDCCGANGQFPLVFEDNLRLTRVWQNALGCLVGGGQPRAMAHTLPRWCPCSPLSTVCCVVHVVPCLLFLSTVRCCSNPGLMPSVSTVAAHTNTALGTFRCTGGTVQNHTSSTFYVFAPCTAMQEGSAMPRP